MTNVVFMIIGWFAVIGGAQCLFAVWVTRQELKESRRWPSATGRITRSEVARQRTGNIKGRSSTLYVPQIEYEYTVDRRLLRGSKVCLGGEMTTSSCNRAETRCRTYPVGAAVDVHYDPIKPQDACLERTSEGLWFVIPLSLAFLLIGLFIVTGLAGDLAQRLWNFMS